MYSALIGLSFSSFGKRKKISVGYLSDAALVSDESFPNFPPGVYVWGQLFGKQLGTGLVSPIRLEFFNDKDIFQVSTSGNHSAFLTKDGKVYTCGYNLYGELGTINEAGDRGGSFLPTQVLFDEPIIQVSCGRNRTIFLTESRDVYMCGISYSKTPEDFSVTDDIQKTPVKITFPDEAGVISLISCGYNRSHFLTENGDVYFCGMKKVEEETEELEDLSMAPLAARTIYLIQPTPIKIDFPCN
jgi:alpha-tubulin suppressor-like RCC1 family protein